MLLKPLRDLSGYEHSEIFLVNDGDRFKILKVLRDAKRLPILESEDPVQMFDREARTLQKLNHPGIPYVEPDNYFTVLLNDRASQQHPQKLYCLVMEYIEGENLEQWMANHPPIDQERALEWLKQLIEILEQVHQNELFHRDIKPSNIMLRPNGQLVLIDFGSARPMTNTYFAKVGGGEQREITSIVSPGYTPLEQVNGKAVPQSDFYALGRTFVYLVTGKHPVSFAEDPQTGTLDWQSHAPQISSGLMNLIDDLMSAFPGQRPLNTQAIQQRLRTIHFDRDEPSVSSLTLAAPSLRTIDFNSAQRPTKATLTPPALNSPEATPKPPVLKRLIALNIGLLILQIATWGLWFRAYQFPNRPIVPESLSPPLNSP